MCIDPIFKEVAGFKKLDFTAVDSTEKWMFMVDYELQWEKHVRSIKTKRIKGVKIGCKVLFSTGQIAEVDGISRRFDYLETVESVGGCHSFRLSNGKQCDNKTDAYAVCVL